MSTCLLEEELVHDQRRSQRRGRRVELVKHPTPLGVGQHAATRPHPPRKLSTHAATEYAVQLPGEVIGRRSSASRRVQDRRCAVAVHDEKQLSGDAPREPLQVASQRPAVRQRVAEEEADWEAGRADGGWQRGGVWS